MNKLSFSILAAAATLSFAAFAQQSTKPAGTIEQLRACLNTQDDIEARQKTLTAQGGQLAKTSESFSERAKELNEEGQRVAEDANATGSGRRARFERKERAYKQEVEAHRKAQEAFNADRKKLEEDFTAFRQKCAEVAYMQDDIDAVKKERAAAGKK